MINTSVGVKTSTPYTNLVLGKWYKLIFEKKGTDVYIALYNLTDNFLLKDLTGVLGTVTSHGGLTIGRALYWPNRYAGGYIRNLKIWQI